MPRTVCLSYPVASPGYPKAAILDLRFLDEKERHKEERFAVGHLYIPPETILTEALLDWICHLENKDWHIYGSASQLSKLKPSAKGGAR